MSFWHGTTSNFAEAYHQFLLFVCTVRQSQSVSQSQSYVRHWLYQRLFSSKVFESFSNCCWNCFCATLGQMSRKCCPHTSRCNRFFFYSSLFSVCSFHINSHTSFDFQVNCITFQVFVKTKKWTVKLNLISSVLSHLPITVVLLLLGFLCSWNIGKHSGIRGILKMDPTLFWN